MTKSTAGETKILANELHARWALWTETHGGTVYAADGAGFELAATYAQGRFTDAISGALLGSTGTKAVSTLRANGQVPDPMAGRSESAAKAAIETMKNLVAKRAS